MKTKLNCKTVGKTLLPACLTLSFMGAGLTQASPYTSKNNAEIRLEGKVVKAGLKNFTLDYGEGAIPVELDDFQYNESYNILVGDEVTVVGRVDADAGETRSIEASTVYIEKLGIQVTGSSVDEEDILKTYVHPVPVVYPNQDLRGEVQRINGREFTLRTVTGEVIIDTGDLPYNPMKGENGQLIELGDWLCVIGVFDEGLFEADEIRARTIVTLKKS